MKDKIKQFLVEQISIPADVVEKLKDDDNLTDYGLDSVNVVYLIAQLEAEYDFTFDEDDLLLANFDTLNRIEASVNRRIAGA